MVILTNITNKIKDLSRKEVFLNGMRVGVVILLMIISFTFGKLSSVGGEREQAQNVAIYLPNGDLYNKNNLLKQSPLSAYILGGATDVVKAVAGPSTTERVKAVENSPEYAQYVDTESQATSLSNTQKEGIFGSKNGHTYYVPGCKSGSRIKLENIVYFTSETDAQDKGYSKSKLCK